MRYLLRALARVALSIRLSCCRPTTARPWCSVTWKGCRRRRRHGGSGATWACFEADWNRWYDDVHLPDALACPGVLRGRRYVTSGEVSESDHGQGKRTKTKLYTTVYELASSAAVETREFNAMRGWAHFAPRVRSQTRVVVPTAA